MNETITNGNHKNELEDDEEAKASIKIWDYVFGFTDMALIKCAIDLKIPDLLEQHGGSISLHDLSTSLKCPTSTNLDRIIKYLIQRKIFKLSKSTENDYIFTQTALSKRLLTKGENIMTPFILFESSPTMLAPWLVLSDRVVGKSKSAFDDANNGEDVWSIATENRVFGKLIDDSMACDARVVIPQVVKGCPKLFDGVNVVVDVGGGDGTTIGLLVKGYPWIQGINFDLPHVIKESKSWEGVEHVGGNMFELVPKADVVIMKWILHDWGDEECIEILKKCKEAISNENGKVIILEAVLEEETGDKLDDARLMLDMVMLAHTTNGKERTLTQWTHVLNQAGFTRIIVTPIHAVQSVIEAYP